jgi:hypothetical protein
VSGRGSSTLDSYIEFQHSDEDTTEEGAELLQAANGFSSSSGSRLEHAPPREEWSWGRLLRDIWKVRDGRGAIIM